jgi:hypothetical protein
VLIRFLVVTSLKTGWCALNSTLALSSLYCNQVSQDSVYLLLGKLLNDQHKKVIRVKGYNYSVLAIALLDNDFSGTYSFEAFSAHNWKNSPLEHDFIQTNSYHDMRFSILSNLVDTLEQHNNFYDFEIGGFSKTDTISINL